MFSCSVVLTDLPDILANLAFNVNHNAQVIKTHGGSATAVVLDWRDSEGALVKYGGDHFEVSSPSTLANKVALTREDCHCNGSYL